MSVAHSTRPHRVAAWLVAAIIAVATSVQLLLIHRGALSHPDEVIATAVVAHLQHQGGVDTNWRHAELPSVFRIDQYNFAGYLLVASVADRGLAAITSASPLTRLRWLSVFFAAAAVALAAIAARSLSGPVAAVAGAALMAASPSLFMEALYARPDSLVTLLAMAALVVFLQGERRGRPMPLVLGLLVGFMISIKLSLLAFYLLLLPVMRDRRAAVLGHAGLLAGFVAGAPAVPLHIAAYLSGIQTLARQYGSDFFPHGLGAAASMPERALYALSWLVQTAGPSLAATACGVAVIALHRRGRVLLALLPFAALFGYFATTAVFIERNFSPSLAAAAVLGGVGIAWAAKVVSRHVPRPGMTTIAGALLIGLCVASALRLDARIVAAALGPYDFVAHRHRIEKAFGKPVATVAWTRAPIDAAGAIRAVGCQPIEVHHAGDARSLDWLRRLSAAGWREVGASESIFEGLTPSTFHTYLSPHVVWLAPPLAACRLSP